MARQTAADRFPPHIFRESTNDAAVCRRCGLIEGNAIHVDTDAPDPAALRAGERPDQEDE